MLFYSSIYNNERRIKMVKLYEKPVEEKKVKKIETIEDIRDNLKVEPQGNGKYRIKFRVFTVLDVELEENETIRDVYDYIKTDQINPFLECSLNKFLRVEEKRLRNQRKYLKEKAKEKAKK